MELNIFQNILTLRELFVTKQMREIQWNVSDYPTAICGKKKKILRQFAAFLIILIIKLSPDEGTMWQSVTVN